MGSIVYYLMFLLLQSQTSDSLNILGIFPHPAISHFKVFQPLLRELAVRGHDVSVVSHFPNNDVSENYHDFTLDTVSMF